MKAVKRLYERLCALPAPALGSSIGDFPYMRPSSLDALIEWRMATLSTCRPFQPG
jgi:hypothetical protein